MSTWFVLTMRKRPLTMRWELELWKLSLMRLWRLKEKTSGSITKSLNVTTRKTLTFLVGSLSSSGHSEIVHLLFKKLKSRVMWLKATNLHRTERSRVLLTSFVALTGLRVLFPNCTSFCNGTHLWIWTTTWRTSVLTSLTSSGLTSKRTKKH